MSSLVYDAGALIAAENGAERMWALHKRALDRGVQPIVPATVVAGVWRGGSRQSLLAGLIRSCVVEDFTAARARGAGALLAHAAHGVVDASVVECALRLRAACVTGNRAHLEALSGRRRLAIIDI